MMQNIYSVVFVLYGVKIKKKKPLYKSFAHWFKINSEKLYTTLASMKLKIKREKKTRRISRTYKLD